MVWGDRCHHPILLERPGWSFLFDGDKERAAQQRQQIFDYLVENKYSVLSYHFPFPGLGALEGKGPGYTWRAAEL